MNYTTNYNLKKPVATDTVNVQDLNDNADAIDAAILAEKEALKEWAGDTFSNPNILINGDFRNPINQRGASSYSVTGYTIDRWKLFTTYATLTVNDGYITLTKTSTEDTPYFVQYIENYELLLGETVTVSIELLDGTVLSTTWTLPTSGGIDTSDLDLIDSSGDTYWNFDIIGSVTSGYLYVRIYNNTTNLTSVNITKIKLEYGSVATPFVPSDDELKCYKYGNMITTNTFIRASRYTANAIEFLLPFPRMRINPSIAQTTAFGVYAVGSSTGTPLSGFVFTYVTQSGYLRILAEKTAHGLTDAFFYIPQGTFVDAEI